MAQNENAKIDQSKAEKRRKEEESIKSFLEFTSAQIVNSWTDSSDRNHETLYKYLTEDFVFDFYPNIEFPWPRTTNLQDFIAHFEKVQKANPSWRIQAYNFSTELDAGLDNAVVWWTSGPSGDPGNDADDWRATNRESVSKLRWRKRSDGEWECFGCLTIRGSSFGDLN